MQTLLFENEFDLPENEHVGGPDFHVNGVARILVLTQAKLGNGLVQTEYLIRSGVQTHVKSSGK